MLILDLTWLDSCWKKNHKGILSKNVLYFFSIIFGFITSGIPAYMRLTTYGSFIGDSNQEDYLIIILFISTFYLAFSNAIQFINCLLEIDQIYQYLSQLSNLISSRKLERYYSKKYLPTINFFDPFTFKSYGILHRVFRNYDQKKKSELNMNLKFSFAQLSALSCVWGCQFSTIPPLSQQLIYMFYFGKRFL